MQTNSQDITLPHFEMILVQGGPFLMGSEDEEAYDDEKPVHEVNVADFYIGKYPVTQALWKAAMGQDNNPSEFKGDNRPVEMVSWLDTQEFLAKLMEMTGKPYRLLSEAEWEYAARGGNQSQGYKYAGSHKLKDVGWYNDNSHGETKPVGLKYPNELGIYDMSGNVFEWVQDQWHDNYEGALTDDPTWEGQEKEASRVVRGGCWSSDAWNCRVAYRIVLDPSRRYFDLGFRLGLSFQGGGSDLVFP